jgi:hypothetical protein
MKWYCPKTYEWDLQKLVYRKMISLDEGKRRLKIYTKWFVEWTKKYFFSEVMTTLEFEQRLRNYNYRIHSWTRIKVFRVRKPITKMGKAIYKMELHWQNL